MNITNNNINSSFKRNDDMNYIRSKLKYNVENDSVFKNPASTINSYEYRDVNVLPFKFNLLPANRTPQNVNNIVPKLWQRGGVNTRLENHVTK
jgi:hypothetical protein